MLSVTVVVGSTCYDVAATICFSSIPYTFDELRYERVELRRVFY